MWKTLKCKQYLCQGNICQGCNKLLNTPNMLMTEPLQAIVLCECKGATSCEGSARSHVLDGSRRCCHKLQFSCHKYGLCEASLTKHFRIHRYINWFIFTTKNKLLKLWHILTKTLYRATKLGLHQHVDLLLGSSQMSPFYLITFKLKPNI